MLSQTSASNYQNGYMQSINSVTNEQVAGPSWQI